MKRHLDVPSLLSLYETRMRRWLRLSELQDMALHAGDLRSVMRLSRKGAAIERSFTRIFAMVRGL